MNNPWQYDTEGPSEMDRADDAAEAHDTQSAEQAWLAAHDVDEDDE